LNVTTDNLMSKILITGGAGFIGANLVRFLIPRGDVIRVLDNLSTGRAQDLDGLPLELIRGDILDPEMVNEAVAGMDIVIHLAAHTGVVESSLDPLTDMQINVTGTLNLLQAAVRHRISRFLFASTGGAIVGNVAPPVHEEMMPRPISPYGAGKLAGEGYCSAFWGSYNLKAVALRFSNVYGPYSYHKGSVIPKFFRQIQRRRELTVYGDGEQTRDFLYVVDLCQAISTALEADLPWGQAIQLGTGEETTINSLVRLLRGVVGEVQFPEVVYAPPRPGEVARNFVSIDKARRFLCFHPQTLLAEGLQGTWKWFCHGKRSEAADGGR